MRWMALLFSLSLVVLLGAACDDEPPIPDDPLPNVRRGLVGFYSGSISEIEATWCDEILLSAKSQVIEAGVRPDTSGIDLSQANFEIVAKQATDRWTVRMTGQYRIWGEHTIQNYDTDVHCPSLIGIKAEGGQWMICGFETPSNCAPTTPVPEPFITGP